MSITSWTSPRASDEILPTSIVINSAMSALCSCTRPPNRLTKAPRTGAGTVRQVANAELAAAIAACTAAASVAGTSNRSSPVIGERAAMRAPAPGDSETPHRSRLRLARWRSSSVEDTDRSRCGVVELIVALDDVVLRTQRSGVKALGAEGRHVDERGAL